MKSTDTTLIRGATFSRVGAVKLPAGVWSVSGKVKHPDSPQVLANFTCTLSSIPEDEEGNNYSVLIEVSSAVTATWPVGSLIADLTFTDDSDPAVVIISNRFRILVQQEV